jgi:hypothetical protein
MSIINDARFMARKFALRIANILTAVQPAALLLGYSSEVSFILAWFQDYTSIAVAVQVAANAAVEHFDSDRVVETDSHKDLYLDEVGPADSGPVDPNRDATEDLIELISELIKEVPHAQS